MLELTTLPDDFLINPVMESNGLFQSDFLLRGLRLRNTGGVPIELLRLELGVSAGGRRLRQVVYAAEALGDRLAVLAADVGHLEGWGAQLFLGRERFWALDRLATSAVLLPGQDAGLFNEYFLGLHRAPVDALEVKVVYAEPGGTREQARTLPVVRYRNQNAFTFPVRGVWQANGNYDCVFAHRPHYSMEFAFDLGQLDLDPGLHDRGPLEDADHRAFGQPVLAVAAGEVVACFNDMPKKVRFSMDAQERAKVWEERLALIAQYGVLPQQCGNHVVIRHAGGEHSFYGHLMHQSLTVERGSRVEQGQAIGRVGNTGLSACPHLHFQLMDGPDFFTARGLPCHFTNLRNQEGRPLPFIQEEYSVVWAG